MSLTKDELIGSLQNEVRILLHLTTKLDASMLEYRPTPKQRSTLELLRYLSFMGPRLVTDAKAGTFNVEAWKAAEQAAAGMSFDQVVEAIEAIPPQYAAGVGALGEQELREKVTFFGQTASRGAFLTSSVLCGHAAYRTQLFLYLKACGRTELSTMNLWGGMDAPQ